jgi:hypothetical protein
LFGNRRHSEVFSAAQRRLATAEMQLTNGPRRAILAGGKE